MLKPIGWAYGMQKQQKAPRAVIFLFLTYIKIFIKKYTDSWYL